MVLLIIIVAIIILFSLLLNGLVIITLCRRWKKLTSHDVILLTISIFDLLQSVVGYFFELYDTDNESACVIVGFIITSLALTAISILTALSISRLLMVLFPFKFFELMQYKRTSLFFTVPSVLYGFSWALFPVIGWGGYEKEHPDRSRCSIDLKGKSLVSLSYLYALLVFVYVLPVGIMVACYIKIRTELQLASRVDGKRRVLKFSSLVSHSRRSEKMFTLMCLVMCVAFLVAWTPYAIVVFQLSLKRHVSLLWLDVSSLLGKSQVVYNPIIYALMYRDFRHSIRTSLFCKTFTAANTWAKTECLVDSRKRQQQTEVRPWL